MLMMSQACAWIGGSHAGSFDGSASGQERQIL